MSHKTLLSKELDFISHEARGYVLDAIYSTLHNKAYSLKGNTEESDIRWFARELWERTTGVPEVGWEGLSQEERARWEEIARASLRALPYLMERISRRMLLMKEVIHTLLQAERCSGR